MYMDEELPRQENTPKQERLRFEVVQKREGITQYVFSNVLVTINFSQEEKRGAPELVYATYDRDPTEASLDKPAYNRPGVDMQYVVTCIVTAAQDLGEDRFWVYPYDEDSLGAGRRVEQWRKHFSNVENAPEHGFYIYI